jgi:hypothetical protein
MCSSAALFLTVRPGYGNDIDSLLSGEYVVVSHEADLVGYSGDWEQWETGATYSLFSFDGEGNGSYQDIFSTGSLNSGSFSYSVNDNGIFQIPGDDPGTIRIVSPDGQSIILADIEESEFDIRLGVKKSTGMSDANLNGEFIVVSHDAELVGYSGSWEQWEAGGTYSLFSFDGQGNGSYQDIFSTGSLNSGSFSYSVNADGTFQIPGDDPHTIRIVSPDGQSIILADIEESQFDIRLGVKKSTGMSDANLRGEYVALLHDAELVGYSGSWEQWEAGAKYRLFSFDGEGNGSYQDIFSTGSLNEGSITYSVNTDGTFHISGDDNNAINIIQPSGGSLLRAEIDDTELSIGIAIAKTDIQNAVDHQGHMELLRTYVLHQNYPNPFNSSTIIRYSVQQPAFVEVNIYNILGVLVRTLVSGEMPVGEHKILWDGKNGHGQTVSSGIYLCSLNSGRGLILRKKMLLLK